MPDSDTAHHEGWRNASGRSSSVRPPTLVVVGLTGVPEVEPGDDLVAFAVAAARRAHLRVEVGDVFVFTQKVVSKAEGRLVPLDSVSPSGLAREWAEAWGGDARVIELALREARRVVRMERGVLISETRHGFVCANSAVDTSNVRPGWAALLPDDPDASARRLCTGLRASFEVPLGVLVSDTFGRPWREGQTDVSIGVAGIPPILDHTGGVDAYGQRLRSARTAVADQVAAAAELVMGKTREVPIAVVRGTGLGVAGLDETSGKALLRRPDQDLFR